MIDQNLPRSLLLSVDRISLNFSRQPERRKKHMLVLLHLPFAVSNSDYINLSSISVAFSLPILWIYPIFWLAAFDESCHIFLSIIYPCRVFSNWTWMAMNNFPQNIYFPVEPAVNLVSSIICPHYQLRSLLLTVSRGYGTLGFPAANYT